MKIYLQYLSNLELCLFPKFIFLIFSPKQFTSKEKIAKYFTKLRVYFLWLKSAKV